MQLFANLIVYRTRMQIRVKVTDGLALIRDEVLLTATAQNLRRLARFLCRAPPPLAEACLA